MYIEKVRIKSKKKTPRKKIICCLFKMKKKRALGEDKKIVFLIKNFSFCFFNTRDIGYMDIVDALGSRLNQLV